MGRNHSTQFMNPGFSRWAESLRVAASAILANRLRSGLTVVGIVIGIAVVTVVAALLEGAQGFINQTAAGLGPGIVRVAPVCVSPCWGALGQSGRHFEWKLGVTVTADCDDGGGWIVSTR